MEYQKVLQNNKVQCLICPRECILSEGQRGFCHVRKNINSELILETYGLNTGLAIDPIEKKPLYHFYPSSKVLSFGTFGCNMGCLFCQNYHMSKYKGVYDGVIIKSAYSIFKSNASNGYKLVFTTAIGQEEIDPSNITVNMSGLTQTLAVGSSYSELNSSSITSITYKGEDIKANVSNLSVTTGTITSETGSTTPDQITKEAGTYKVNYSVSFVYKGTSVTKSFTQTVTVQ